MSQPPERERRSTPVLWTLAIVLVAFTVLVFGARDWWLGELAASFRWQLGLVALIIAPVAVLRGRSALGWVMLGLGAWHAAPESKLWLPGAEPSSGGPQWTLLTANLRWRNGDAEGVTRWMAEVDADVMFVQEVSPRWREVLRDLEASYPHQIYSPVDPWGNDEWGVAVLSRLPFERTHRIEPDVDTFRPLLEVALDLAGTEVVLRGMHPIRPGEPDAWRRRNTILRTMMDQEWGPASILMGDLNTTSGSPMFADLIRATGLRDSRAGFGRLASFTPPPKLPFLRVAIDHILLGERFEVFDRRTATIPGSDHRAGIARIGLAGPLD